VVEQSDLSKTVSERSSNEHFAIHPQNSLEFTGTRVSIDDVVVDIRKNTYARRFVSEGQLFGSATKVGHLGVPSKGDRHITHSLSRFHSDHNSPAPLSHQNGKATGACLARYNGTRRLHSTLKNLRAATAERIQTITVAIDNMILQVTAGPWPTDRPHRVISGEQRRWDAYVIDIWPIQQPDVAWPPLQRVTDEDLYAFADRFERGIKLVSPEAEQR
jgi:hypothetical protein